MSGENFQAGSMVGVHRGPHRPYTVLNVKGHRAIVTDGLTHKKSLPLKNLRSWENMGQSRNKPTTNFQTMDSRDRFDVRELKLKTDAGINPDVPLRHRDLKVELYESGVPLELVVMASPYQEKDIPHKYSNGKPHEVNRGVRTQKVGWVVGTSDTIENIAHARISTSQNPSVLVQWCSNEYSDHPSSKTVERRELQEIKDGCYVQRVYNGGSMGNFDGKMSSIRMLEKCDGWGDPPQKDHKISSWYRTADRKTPWRLFTKDGDTCPELLNGISQLLTFYPNEITKVK